MLDRRWIAVMALMALVVSAACSGEPRPEAAAEPASAESPGVSEDGVADAGDTSKKSGTTKKGGGGSSGGGATTSSGGSSVGGSPTYTPPAGPSVDASGNAVDTKAQIRRSEKLEKKLPDVNLWPASTSRMGITDDTITFCFHAALTYADVFDTRVEDLNSYWEAVNANGGVYGRNVQVTFEDDAYRPDDAVQAAERCKAKEPFVLGGGIGFDQIPAVRAWNEQENNRFLYLHHIAQEDHSKQYSYSFLPTVEQSGTLAARMILKKHRSQDIGAIWRQSDSWQPGHKTFLSTMERGGVELVADLPVQKDQAVYSQQINALSTSGAEVVFVWENALAATEIIKQAKAQNYSPIWVVFPFNLTADTLGDDSLNPKLEGIAVGWRAYSPGIHNGPFKSYAGEIKRFEAALDKYGTAQKGNDILWMTWMGFKQLHQLLLDCGPDCDRNQMVALIDLGRAQGSRAQLQVRFHTQRSRRGPLRLGLPGVPPPGRRRRLARDRHVHDFLGPS